MWKVNIVFYPVLICVYIAGIYAQQNEGDACFIAEKNAPGQCRILKDCPVELQDLWNGKYPQTCGYIGSEPIVCCAGKVPPTRKPTGTVIPTRKPGDTSLQNECYRGTCKLLIDCPSAIQMIQDHQNPELCSYNKYMPMVCCWETTYHTSTTELIPDFITTVPPSKEILSTPPKEDISPSPPLVEVQESRNSEEACSQFQNVELKQREKLNYKDKEKQKSEILNNEIAEFPHKVALGIAAVTGGHEFLYENGIQWTCGGSLISSKFILTAAHCLLVDGRRTLEYANIGNALLHTYFALTNPKEVVYKINRQFPHPLYKSPSVYHDIGLVELQRPVEFTEYARPACLHQNIDQETELISAGWGLGNKGIISEKIQKVNFNVYSQEDCAGIYKDLNGSERLPMGIVHQEQFCAGGVNDLGNIDSIKCDSGGALQFNFNNTNKGTVPYIVGIRSFGESLGLKGIPAIYTRVAPYLPWIESIVWPQSDLQISTQQLSNVSVMPAPQATPTIITSRVSTSLSDRKCLFFREAEDKNVDLVYKPGASEIVPIFGGEDASPGEFPHMVALGFSKSEREYDITWQCGGSLISEKFVLTAAHCLASQDFGNLSWAFVGRRYLYTYNDLVNPGQLVYQIIRQIPHPSYKRPSTYHDIALLELERPVVFTSESRPACLLGSDIDLKTAIATGWGLTELGETIAILQKATLDMFTTDECDQTYENLNNTRRLRNGIMRSSQFCAGKRSGIQDTCQGDSGGPLQFKIPNYTGNVWHISGLTSFSKSCGLQGRPGVYTRVSNYVPWIESIVWPGE